MDVDRRIKKGADRHLKRFAQTQKDFDRRQLVASLNFANVRDIDAIGDLLSQVLLCQTSFMAQALEDETQLTSQRLLISIHVTPMLPVRRTR